MEGGQPTDGLPMASEMLADDSSTGSANVGAKAVADGDAADGAKAADTACLLLVGDPLPHQHSAGTAANVYSSKQLNKLSVARSWLAGLSGGQRLCP